MKTDEFKALLEAYLKGANPDRRIAHIAAWRLFEALPVLEELVAAGDVYFNDLRPETRNPYLRTGRQAHPALKKLVEG